MWYNEARVPPQSAYTGAMHALVRRGSQVASSQLPALTRAVAAASSRASSSTGKPVMEKEFLVYRWDPERESQPQYQSYKVDLNA